ncbi:MAG: helix-turn-helix domain-containing protein [Planctomycetota bacterium]
MERVGIDDESLGRAVGVHRSTISRIRRKCVVPDGTTLLKIDRWAAEKARHGRLRRSERLTWHYLLDAAA